MNYVTDRIITEAQAEVFREATRRRYNILIAGATGSGKTTFAGALINEMVEQSDPSERYVIIEDTLEIQCRAAKSGAAAYQRDADLTRLVRATMRLRPGPHHHRRSPRRRSARAAQGVADRSSGRRHDDSCQQREVGADQAFQPSSRSGRAAAAGTDRRDHSADRFHRPHT